MTRRSAVRLGYRGALFKIMIRHCLGAFLCTRSRQSRRAAVTTMVQRSTARANRQVERPPLLQALDVSNLNTWYTVVSHQCDTTIQHTVQREYSMKSKWT